MARNKPKGKLVVCGTCGKKVHFNKRSVGQHRRICNGDGLGFRDKDYIEHSLFPALDNPKKKKRKYTKHQKVEHPSQLPSTEFKVEYPTHVVATLQVEIDMVKGIELGVIKFVAKD